MKSTTEIQYATYSELKQRGIKHISPRLYLKEYDPEGYNVYTYIVYCIDGTIWHYSSEDELFTKEI